MADNRGYNQYDDPEFLKERHQLGRLGLGPVQIYGGLCLVVVALIIKEMGPKTAIAAAAVLLIIGIVWVIIRKKHIQQATQTGFVNKNGQANCKCVTPGWKYDKSFYKLECRHCGNTYDVRADRIRSKKCPACQ